MRIALFTLVSTSIISFSWAKNPVVRQHNLLSRNTIGSFCSGFFLQVSDQILYVTANHCLDDVHNYNIKELKLFFGWRENRKNKNSMILKADLMKRDFLNDLAFTVFDREKIPQSETIYTLRSQSASIGMNVSMNGYGRGEGIQKVNCQLLNFGAHRFTNFDPFILRHFLLCDPPNLGQDGELTIDDSQGFSGGPILDENENVVGSVSRGNVRDSKNFELYSGLPGLTFRNEAFTFEPNAIFRLPVLDVSSKLIGSEDGHVDFCTDETGQVVLQKMTSSKEREIVAKNDQNQFYTQNSIPLGPLPNTPFYLTRRKGLARWDECEAKANTNLKI